MKILYGDRLVTELRKQSDKIKERLWITVPFIGGLATVRKIIGRRWIENPAISVRLLADTNEFNNFNSETIRLFNERGEIKHLAGLHAKIFIADDECLITSANLTNTAFSKRHEIGIFLDKANAEKTVAIFEDWWNKSDAVSLDSLNTFFGRQFDSKEEREGNGLQRIWMLPKDPGKPSGNLERKFLNYDSLLRDHSDFAAKYATVQRLWPAQPIFFETDCFLNYLYHDAPGTPSKSYQSKAPRSLSSKQQMSELQKYARNFGRQVDKGAMRRYVSSSQVVRRKLAPTRVANLTRGDIREIFDCLNSLNSFPINKTKILRNNATLQIRRAFDILVNGKQSLALRMNECSKIRFIGSSSMNEILGFAFPNRYPLINKNSNSGLRFFGYKIPAYR